MQNLRLSLLAAQQTSIAPPLTGMGQKHASGWGRNTHFNIKVRNRNILKEILEEPLQLLL
jgi:hypothetical protein